MGGWSAVLELDGPRAFYESELQGLWALLVVPALWLAVRVVRGRPAGEGVEPAAARFVDAFALVFAVQTLSIRSSTGPGRARARRRRGPTALSLLFVLLGDFRVLPARRVPRGRRDRLGPRSREAAVLTPIVPIFAWLATRALGAALGAAAGPGALAGPRGELPRAAALAAPPRRGARARSGGAARALPARGAALRGAYYALWALCDVGILLGLDWAYAVRAVPNQLYYALFVPVRARALLRGLVLGDERARPGVEVGGRARRRPRRADRRRRRSARGAEIR